MVSTALAAVPCTIAGISLAAEEGGGLCWLTPTALPGIVGAVYNAWVLLVQIVRCDRPDPYPAATARSSSSKSNSSSAVRSRANSCRP
jgi:hypothetical protein